MNPHKDERARFEKWLGGSKPTVFNNQYLSPSTELAWLSWQARAALSAEPIAPIAELVRVLKRCLAVMNEVETHERKTFFTYTKQDVEEVLASVRDSEKEGGTAVCEKCGATERNWKQEGVYPICTTGEIHPWVGPRASLAGSVGNSSTSTTTRNSAEATAIPPTSTSTPVGTAERNSASDAPAPISVEELAREIVTIIRRKYQYSAASDAVPEIAALLRSHWGERWIPVSERLPEDNERVLVWFNEGRIDGWRTRFGYRVSGHWRPEGGNGNFDHQVAYWRPLPSPPREEKA